LEKANQKAIEDIAVIPLHLGMDTYALQKSTGIKFIPRPDGWLVVKEMSLK
jgi:hypothetical protein